MKECLFKEKNVYLEKTVTNFRLETEKYIVDSA